MRLSAGYQYYLPEKLDYPAKKLEQEFLQGTKVGATPVSHGAALPHLRIHELGEPELLLVRSKIPVRVDIDKALWGEHIPDGPIYAFFFLISPEENPGQHLRILAKIASCADDDFFLRDWQKASNEQEIREILLHDEHFETIELRAGTSSSVLINKEIRGLELPEQCLVAIVRREGEMIVPHGDTILKKGDRLTIIGNKKSILEFRSLYGDKQ